jgi:hypothetical protein
MDKRNIDDAACDSTKRLEEQVDAKLREALERFREIYGMGGADGLTGVARKGVSRHSK